MKYAVVRLDIENEIDKAYYFCKWHETEQEAIHEACRLTEKEQGKFGILMLIGVTKIPSLKAEYKDYR